MIRRAASTCRFVSEEENKSPSVGRVTLFEREAWPLVRERGRDGAERDELATTGLSPIVRRVLGVRASDHDSDPFEGTYRRRGMLADEYAGSAERYDVTMLG